METTKVRMPMSSKPFGLNASHWAKYINENFEKNKPIEVVLRQKTNNITTSKLVGKHIWAEFDGDILVTEIEWYEVSENIKQKVVKDLESEPKKSKA